MVAGRAYDDDEEEEDDDDDDYSLYDDDDDDEDDDDDDDSDVGSLSLYRRRSTSGGGGGGGADGIPGHDIKTSEESLRELELSLLSAGTALTDDVNPKTFMYFPNLAGHDNATNTTRSSRSSSVAPLPLLPPSSSSSMAVGPPISPADLLKLGTTR